MIPRFSSLVLILALAGAVRAQTVTITALDSSAAESGLFPGAYWIERAGATGSPLTVNLSYSGSGVAGRDYEALPASVVIPAGEAGCELTLRPVNDPDVEPGPDTVTATVQPGAGYAVGSPASADVFIEDNETFTNTCPLLYKAVPVSSTAITIYWTDNFETETGYKVGCAPAGTTPSASTSLPANSTSHTFTGLAEGVTYVFRVVAVGANSTLSQYSDAGNSGANGLRQIALTGPAPAPACTTFEQWRATVGLDGELRSAAGRTDDDPDGDGRVNLMEYLLRSDPLVPDSAGINLSASVSGLRLAWPENPDLLDASLVLKESTTLASWTPSPLVTTYSNGERSATDERGGDRRFYRLSAVTALDPEPGPTITCWGDSLTGNPGTYVDKLPAALALLGSAGRSTQQGGIGGDVSSQIRDRLHGATITEPFPATSGNATATARIVASRTVHNRIMSAGYKSSWPSYSATIANVSRVEFFNFGSKIGESSTPLSATVTSNRTASAKRLISPGNPFEDGFVVHFPSGPLPGPLVAGKTYLVRDRDAGGFSLVDTDLSVSISGASATPSSTFTSNGHPFQNGDPVWFPAVPSGFQADQIYYVSDVTANTFAVSSSPGGNAITTVYASTGTVRGFGNRLGPALSLTADFAAPTAIKGPFVLGTSLPAGPLSLSLRTHADRDTNTFIIWMGRNNNTRPHLTYADVHAAVEQIKSMNGRFLIVSVTNGVNSGTRETAGSPYYYQTVNINSLLKKEFPDNFVDVREELVRYDGSPISGLTAPNNIPAGFPTAQDLLDRADDIPPLSLRNGPADIHFNDYGQQIIANLLAAKIHALGW